MHSVGAGPTFSQIQLCSLSLSFSCSLTHTYTQRHSHSYVLCQEIIKSKNKSVVVDVLCIITVHGDCTTTVIHCWQLSLSLSLSLALSKIMMLNQDLTVPISHSKPDVLKWTTLCVYVHMSFTCSFLYLYIICLYSSHNKERPQESYTNIHMPMYVFARIAFMNVSGQSPEPPLAPEGFSNSQRSQTQSAPALSWPQIEVSISVLLPCPQTLGRLSSCHKCHKPLSHKINEPTVTGQMTI